MPTAAGARRLTVAIVTSEAGRTKVTAEQALEEFNRVKDALYLGRDPCHFGQGATVENLCNHFMDAKDSLKSAGELSQRSFDDYLRTCKRLTNQLSRSRSVSTLGPADFDEMRSKLAMKLGKVALGIEIGRVRVVFKFGYDAEILEKPVRFGPHFKRPTQRQIRIEKQSKPRKLFNAKDINKLLAKASEPLNTMILLGINCA